MPALAPALLISLSILLTAPQLSAESSESFVARVFDDTRETPLGVAAGQDGQDFSDVSRHDRRHDGDGTLRISFLSEHEFTSRLGASASLDAQLPDAQRDIEGSASGKANRRTVFAGGLSYDLHRAQLDVRAAADQDGRSGLGATLRAKLDAAQLELRLSHHEVHGLTREIGVRPRFGAAQSGRVSDIEVTAHPELPGLGRAPVTLGGSRSESTTGETWYGMTGRLEGDTQGVSHMVETRWSFGTSDSDGFGRSWQVEDGELNLRLATELGRFDLRGQLGYALAPERQWDFVKLAVDWAPTDDLDVHFGARRAHGHDTTSLSGRLRWSIGPLDLGFDGKVDTDGGFSARVNLRATFGPGSRDGYRDE